MDNMAAEIKGSTADILYFLNWCCNVITCYTNISYVMIKPQFTRPSN
jgi:hypothetical protein